MVLEIKALKKRYGTKTALDNVSFTLERGKIVGLLGPNGSGKTTLIKLVNGLLSSNGGSISIAGLPVGVESKNHISYLPERTYLNLDSKVKDCIKMFEEFYKDFDSKKAYDLLAQLKINPKDKLNLEFVEPLPSQQSFETFQRIHHL